MNNNYVGKQDAINTDESEQFLICFGLNEDNNPIAYIVPKFLFTREFRRINNIGMFWKKYFYDLNQAKEEAKQFEYQELVIIDESL